MTAIELGTPFFGDPHSPILCLVGNDHAVPTDLCQSPALRANAVARRLRSPAVLVDESAVFVHTGRWTIDPLSLRSVPTAPLPGKSTRWTTDRRLLKDHHLTQIGSAYVTTMARTAADLLVLPPERALPGIVHLLRHGVDVREVREILGQRFRGRDSWQASQLIGQIARHLPDYPGHQSHDRPHRHLRYSSVRAALGSGAYYPPSQT